MNLNILKCILLGLHTFSKPVKINEYRIEKKCVYCPYTVTTYTSTLNIKKNLIISQLKNDCFIHARTSLNKLIEELGYE